VMSGTSDVDYTSSQSTFNVTWQDVFIANYDVQYEIAVGTIPAGELVTANTM